MKLLNLLSKIQKEQDENNYAYAFLPKFSILPPVSDGILLRLWSDDPIQILLNLAWFLTLRTKLFLEGFVWSH